MISESPGEAGARVSKLHCVLPRLVSSQPFFLIRFHDFPGGPGGRKEELCVITTVQHLGKALIK